MEGRGEGVAQRHLSTQAILCQQLLQSEKTLGKEAESFKHYSKGVTLYPLFGLFAAFCVCVLLRAPTVWLRPC